VDAVSQRRAALAVLLAGAGMLVAVWRLAPAPLPPLYDGLQLPAEPYRYLNPPPGLNTKPPGSVVKDLPLRDGKTPAIAEATDEMPAQAQFLAQPDTFIVPAGTAVVTLTIAPVPAAAPAPAGESLDGNVYRITVTAKGQTQSLAMRPTLPATVVLRGPAQAGDAHMAQLTGGAWSTLPTTPVGAADTYSANITSLGDFVLLLPVSAASPPGDSGGSSAGLIITIASGAVLLLVAGGILAIRRSRSQGAPSGTPARTPGARAKPPRPPTPDAPVRRKRPRRR
jgi:hypothetical protein